MMNKIIGALVGVGLLVGTYFYVAHLQKQIVVKDGVIAQRDADIKRAGEVITEERNNSITAQKNAAEFAKRLKVVLDENDKRDKCIAAGNCVVRVYIKPKTCTVVPDTGSNAGSTESITAELGERSQRAYAILRRDIKIYNEMYNLCIIDLQSKSGPEVNF